MWNQKLKTVTLWHFTSETWATSMETDEITPLHFTVRNFIYILVKNINLVTHGWNFRAVSTDCNKLILLNVLVLCFEELYPFLLQKQLFENINSLWDFWICSSLQELFRCIFKPCWVWYPVFWLSDSYFYKYTEM